MPACVYTWLNLGNAGPAIIEPPQKLASICESFPEYLDLLERVPKRLNVAAMIGHSALRLFAMGDDALERPADPNEVQTMQRLVREALAAGAAGFATSRSGSHIGHLGKPVASRIADTDELLAIVDAVESAARGVIQIAAGNTLDEVEQIARHTTRPVTWSALLTGRYAPVTALDMVQRTAELPGWVLPQISCRPLVLQMTLREPRGFASLNAFAEVLALPIDRRSAHYRDAEWRDRARVETNARWGSRWGSVTIDESPTRPDAVDRSLLDLATDAGQDPFDTLVELALADDLATRFTFTIMNDDEAELGALLRDERTLLGLSDAGAHASQLCDACYSTHLLGHWVRARQALPLELAVWRLTGQPATVFGFADRGVLKPGAVADLVAFDASTVAPGRRERRNDLPGGAERLVVHAVGVEHVWIAGQAVVENGRMVDGATPGRLLRPDGKTGVAAATPAL